MRPILLLVSFATLAAAIAPAPSPSSSPGAPGSCAAFAEEGVPCLDAGTTGPWLDGQKPPQFVMITHDDAVTERVFDIVGTIRRCGAPATFYTLAKGSNCDYVKALYDNGDEIALHTTHHEHSTGVPAEHMEYELANGVRKFLNETCGVPAEDLVGFRAPYLETDDAVRRAIYADGKIRYDSTFNNYYESKWSKDAANRLWPYTQHDPNGPFKNSTAGVSESYPGMWSLPLLEMQGPTDGEFVMDPSKSLDPLDPTTVRYGNASDVLALLKANFDQVYAGARSPIGLYIHVDWLSQPGFADLTSEFIEYVNAFEDARFVTANQLVDWLESPVPASEMPPKDLTCRTAFVPPKTFWQRTWAYWVTAIVAVGPVLLAITAVWTITGCQHCMRRFKRTETPAPTPLPAPAVLPVIPVIL